MSDVPTCGKDIASVERKLSCSIRFVIFMVFSIFSKFDTLGIVGIFDLTFCGCVSR